MPAYMFKLSGEIAVGKTLDEQSIDIAKVKALVAAVDSQSLTPDAIDALTAATNLHVQVKMVSRTAKVKTDAQAG